MLFNEENAIKLPKFGNSFVYFLLKDNEVVYVGKTSNGITRPLSHKNKIYDEIYILYCNEENLTDSEDDFILKYRPIYNKNCKRVVQYGINKAFKKLHKEFGSELTIKKFKEIFKKLNITPFEFNGIETIKIFEFYDIVNYLRRNKI